MIPMSLAQIAQVTDGQLLNCPDAALMVKNISTDTRTVSAGALFLALQGERFDAHDFAAQAADKDAVAIVVSRPLPDVSLPQILVADTRIALGQIAAWVRNQLDLQIVAITGSCGKTTVKEMCAAILRQSAPVLATQGNLNNEIGVPQTLLRLTPDERYAVVELGANHPGEIAWTTSLVKPDVAVINNVAAAHLAGFGSLRGVAVAKTEIFSGLSETGTAIINADSEFYDWWREILSVRTLSFGVENPKADFRAENIEQNEAGIASFMLICPLGRIAIQLPVPGLHNVSNALAAAAVTTSLGLSLEQVKSGLMTMVPVKGRFCVQKLSDSVTVIDDTYNASVQSVMAAIDTLSVMPGHRVLVFGDMGELGADAATLHRQIGEHAKAKKLDTVLTIGELSRNTAEAASGQHFVNKESLYQALQQLMQQQRPVTILAKGARSARMEDVVAFVKSCEEKTAC
ncbi:MAG: UDP-N-acetylmuramoyl-tripeptide--D-alanyl-D-alanine ligase [Tolumonas sp.]|nr:MAG: UDP-N-acetylmuramoyl-tripeptide--D-alanyl-D-alanine ligase [Tolumonas sp.]